ncbi:three-Cys-motif partner protein TcmP [Acrocarpospora sp. B8E8]|uniref:three-Cys-motif partner protein TcmP n=1 Tax=Acrocarpospora sp. B8E8 TaxID=3153572 RepID=UPI00325EBFC2
MMAREWGWWTEQKLDILSGYLTGFANATRKAGTTVYLDLFAGQPDNVSREPTRHMIRGSARRALDTSPPFSVLKFFEMPGHATALEKNLQAEYPGRDFRVIPGDCNDEVESVLQGLRPLNWAPTFAFLDQQSTEVKWATLEHLARFKRQGKPKAELWLLCASGLLPRGLRLRQELIDDNVACQMSLMFGTDQWQEALSATRSGRLSATEFRAELTNLMRWRLQKDLGYKVTRVFKVKNTSGSEIFDMIFATDHEVGDKIMKWMYSKAQKQQGALQDRARRQRQQKREEEQGKFGLFNAEDALPVMPTGFDVHAADEPAHPPYRASRTS